MPEQTNQAIEWALTQKTETGDIITIAMCHDLVDKVREYFNANNISYGNFSYDDLIPYLSLSE